MKNWGRWGSDDEAGALNFIGRSTLFGRYWGCVEDLPFLPMDDPGLIPVGFRGLPVLVMLTEQPIERDVVFDDSNAVTIRHRGWAVPSGLPGNPSRHRFGSRADIR